MISNANELEVTQKRIEYFHHLLEQIRTKATPEQCDLMASGYRLEIERMQAGVMNYLLRPLTTSERQPACVVAANSAPPSLSCALIAILENYQQADGSIAVPDALRKWVGKVRIGGDG